MSLDEFVQHILAYAGLGAILGALVGIEYERLRLEEHVDWDRNAAYGGVLGATFGVGVALYQLVT